VSVYTIFVAIGVVQFQCNHGRPGQEGAPAVPWKMYNAIDSLQFQHFGSYKKKETKSLPQDTFRQLKIALAAGALPQTSLVSVKPVVRSCGQVLGTPNHTG